MRATGENVTNRQFPDAANLRQLRHSNKKKQLCDLIIIYHFFEQLKNQGWKTLQ